MFIDNSSPPVRRPVAACCRIPNTCIASPHTLMSASSGWEIQTIDSVAIVTMNSNKANFVNAKFVDDFEAALNRLENEPALKDKAVVLTGHGKAFSAGFDLRMILSGDFRPTVGKYGICVLRLLNLGRPTIAAINGHCFAAGMITALCCDRLVALDSDYKFGLSEVHLGISLPALGVELCRLKMDPRTVMKSLVFGTMFSPNEALQAGFVHHVAKSDSFISSAAALAKSIAPPSFEAFGVLKKSILKPMFDRLSLPESKDLDDDFERMCVEKKAVIFDYVKKNVGNAKL